MYMPSFRLDTYGWPACVLVLVLCCLVELHRQHDLKDSRIIDLFSCPCSLHEWRDKGHPGPHEECVLSNANLQGVDVMIRFEGSIDRL